MAITKEQVLQLALDILNRNVADNKLTEFIPVRLTISCTKLDDGSISYSIKLKPFYDYLKSLDISTQLTTGIINLENFPLDKIDISLNVFGDKVFDMLDRNRPPYIPAAGPIGIGLDLHFKNRKFPLFFDAEKIEEIIGVANAYEMTYNLLSSNDDEKIIMDIYNHYSGTVQYWVEAFEHFDI